MRNGGIGQGWAIEDPQDEIILLANDLLKSKLNEIWGKIREAHAKGKTIGVRGARFGFYKYP